MKTLLVNVHDENKADDLLRFLKDIDFLDVKVEEPAAGQRNRPSSKLAGTAIVGDIVSPAVPEKDWESLR